MSSLILPHRSQVFKAPSGFVMPSSTLIDLDATQSDSTDTANEWVNIGAGGSAYDFNLGDSGIPAADTAEPVLTGSGASAYFLWTIGDFCSLKGADTQFIKDMHKTTGGNDWWFGMALQSQIAAGNQWLWGNERNAVHGVGVVAQNTEVISCLQRGAAASLVEIEPVDTWAAEETSIIVSHSHSTNVTRSWHKTKTGSDSAQTFSTSTTDPVEIFVLGIRAGDLNQGLDTGVRVYAFVGGTGFLNDTGAGEIVDVWEDRHERTYV